MGLQITITPTTTLSAETSNNTSAASTFTAQTNGNIAPANASKVNVHTLLYPGATTKIYAHFMGWFGQSNHMNVGYSSADANQVQRQVDDMMSRGFDGAVIDWYGPAHYADDAATQLMMNYAQALPGVPFKFAIMEDAGALGTCVSTYGCDLNKTLVSHLTYIHDNYECSPAYMTINGQPVVFLFGLEAYNIDWNYVKANAPGNPTFIFQNAGGFTHAASGGAFGWVLINPKNPNDWEQSYLDGFYQTAIGYPVLHAFGATYKGFNDSLAAWGSGRVVNQNCGQTWLSTWNEIGKFYSSSRQLESVQIATWNDYEEGTEIETGIDNCATVSANESGDNLSWSINGDESTIDHYTVFISQDGENLMPLVDTSAGVHALDLSTFSFAPGNYSLYVKAVGKPSIVNHMSNAASYYVAEPIVPGKVTITSPMNGAIVNSPVHFAATATANTGNVITAMRVYVDSADVYTVGANSIDTSVALAPGAHNVVIQAWDNTGVVYKSAVDITVAAPPTTGVITIISPGAGVALPNSVHILANAQSPYPITSMQVQVDGVNVYAASAAAIDTYINLPAGSHTLVIQASDSSTATFSSSVEITVRSILGRAFRD